KLEKASKILEKQCLSEMNEEVLLILHAQARQLQKIVVRKNVQPSDNNAAASELAYECKGGHSSH
ncbi:hypothetical protein RJ035_008366, partial [Blastomyces gilchristii]